ncbi:MAG: phospho-sugar mutase [Clostridiales bacterium]|jgi:phosphoglucomutase|nr:phospho-sugar mutase [Clostridiales bacterium]
MYRDVYEKWLNHPNLDEKSRAELQSFEGNDDEIKDRFYKDLEFGTGGLRGKMGVGSNRMNIYTVRKVTAGLAAYIKRRGDAAMARGVVIGFDSRNNSRKFAYECAHVLAANGIHAHIYPDLRPTPQLSFSVRHLRTIAGIMITASHNTKEYNGYKCYWEDGGQMPPGVSFDLLALISEVNELEPSEESGNVADFIHELSADIDEAYMRAVAAQQLNPGGNIKIAYTPLYGAGNKPVREALKRAGFDNVLVESKQEQPNGNFPTAPYPNPEKAECWEKVLALAEREKTDLALATDPDSDRIGVAAQDKWGLIQRFSGNEVGIMLTEYVLSQQAEKGRLPENPLVVSTIVSSRMTALICKARGVKYLDVYTGFKFIAEKILECETERRNNFVLGWEESIGYLVGAHARDKDAIVAAIIIAEMAQWCADRGVTLWDYLDEIYEKYGRLYEESVDVIKEGFAGADEIAEIMRGLRESPPKEIGGVKIASFTDYALAKEPSNMLAFELESGSVVRVRPSGTEPKIKFYFSAVNPRELERIKEEMLS